MNSSPRPFTRFSWLGFTPQLILFIIIPLTLVLLAVSFGNLRLHQNAMRNLVAERDTRAVTAAASAISEQIHHRQSAMRILALSLEGDPSAQSLARLLQASDFLLADFDLGLAVFSPQGQALATLDETRFWSRLTGAAVLQPALASQAPSLSTILHPDLGKPVMLVSAPASDGSLVAMGAVSLERMIQPILSDLVAPFQGGSALILSQEHGLVYQIGPLPSESSLEEHVGVQEAFAGVSGATIVDRGSLEHVVAYSPIQPVGWALLVEEPWEMVTSPELRATADTTLVLIPVVILFASALWFASRRIIQPLTSLEAKAKELAWGDYTAIRQPVGGITEIQSLQAELINLARKVQAAQAGLRGYIEAMSRGQEEERRRLARELHDDTLQALIALNQRIQLAQLSLAQLPESENLAEIQKLIEQAIQNLRRITRALRPIYLEDLGLVTALEMLVREVQQGNPELQVQFRHSGKEKRLEPQVELALYRMAQEALSNVQRHAAASHATLSLAYVADDPGAGDFVIIEVSDDGRGFDLPDTPTAFAPSGHFGLLGLYERAEMLGARLQIQSEPGNGAQVKITLPLSPG